MKEKRVNGTTEELDKWKIKNEVEKREDRKIWLGVRNV